MQILDRRIDENLDEFAACRAVSRTMLPLGPERRDEGAQHDQPGLGHQLGDFADAADIFDPVDFGEAEIAVEPMADIVAVEQDRVARRARGAATRRDWRWSICRRPKAR